MQKKNVVSLKDTIEKNKRNLEKTIEKNRESARKAVYKEDGTQKFVREETFDKFQEDMVNFQSDMRDFKTETLLSLQSVTNELKNIGKAISESCKAITGSPQ